jgi:hypothetical protein
MHFRQRIAWLLLATYLVVTAGALYYVFEMNARFSVFALEHADVDHLSLDSNPLRHGAVTVSADQVDATSQRSVVGHVWSTLQHVADIPFSVIMVLVLFVYLQVTTTL